MLDTNCDTDGDNLRKAGLVEVFLQEQGRLKRIIAGMGLGAWDAEDILQDVSIKALKHSEQRKERGKALGWLIKVTVNCCFTEHRRRKSFMTKALELFDRKQRGGKAALGPDKIAVCTEEKAVLHATLLELDRKMLMTLVLRYFCDMNASEISEILNITPSAVRTRISRGREILAKKLAKRGVSK